MINLRDFRVGWRLLIGEPVYSVVVIAGLALGFAACFLLLGYVQYSFTYDAQVPDNKHVYLVKSKRNLFSPPIWNNSVPLPLSVVAKTSGLTSASSIVSDIEAVIRVDNRIQKLKLSAVDPDFPQLFGIQVVAGDLTSALVRPDAVALTQSKAEKLFGKAKAIDKTVDINGKSFQVVALIPDQPANTTESYEALVGTHSAALSEKEKDPANWISGSDGRLYMKLRIAATTTEVEKVLQGAIDQFGFGARSTTRWTQLGFKTAEEIRLISLADSYFDQDLARRGDRANKKVIMGLAFVATLILLLAAINYVNLAIVRILRRQREIGLRKVLGARVSHVISQFMAESILVSMTATLLGLLMAWLLLPMFSELMARKLDTVFTVQNFIVAVLSGIFIGLLTGAYPAWIALQVRSSESVAGRGNHETSSGLWVRRFLTVMQFAVAMGFTGLTLVIVWQADFASNIDPGFNPAQLEIIDMPVDLKDPGGLAFRNKVSQLQGVSGVAASGSPPGGNTNKVTGGFQIKTGKTVILSLQNIDPNYFDVYQVKPRAGRLFDRRIDIVGNENVIVINGMAARVLGFSSPESAVGQLFPDMEGKTTIIGIAPDIRHHSIREVDQPILYCLRPFTSVLTVRVNGDLKTVEKEIESIWSQTFPTDAIAIRSAKMALGENYANDIRLAKLLAASSLLAIALAAFGIYVLSAYTVQRRTKEIVLRKLYGANGGVIAQLLAWEFGSLITVSALIGLPIAYVASAKYLAEFVERAPMGVWPLLAALLVASMIAFLAVLRHSILALRISPAIVLR